MSLGRQLCKFGTENKEECAVNIFLTSNLIYVLIYILVMLTKDFLIPLLYTLIKSMFS